MLVKKVDSRKLINNITILLHQINPWCICYIIVKLINNNIYLNSPVVSLIHYIGNRVMVLSIRFFDGFVFWVGN